ncbi:hypothetical protein FA132_26950 [Pseudomonas aeruginosa]|nr:hypothetical protein [Pseudomonas aeruginosa]
MNSVTAIYLVDLQELLLGNGRTVKVPPQVAVTVSPRMLDLRFVRRWAIFHKHVTDAADIAVAV